MVRTEDLPDKIDHVRVPKRLYSYVNMADSNKDMLAKLQLADLAAGAMNKYPRINLYDVTMGLGSGMNRFECNSSIMQHLEKQLIEFYHHRKQYNRQFH